MPRSGESVYDQLYRRADVWDRWAADFFRLWAAQARFEAEVFKAVRAEQIAGWLARKLSR